MKRVLIVLCALVSAGVVAMLITPDVDFHDVTPGPTPTPPATTIPWDSGPEPTRPPDATPYSATGRVTAGGRPFEGARIYPARRKRGGLEEERAAPVEATSDRDGLFEIRMLPEPPFELVASADGWRPARVEIGSFGGKTRVEGIELALLPAGAIRGRVTAAGAPVAGARIAAGNEGDTDRGLSIEAQAETDERGEFRLTPVRPGTMSVAAFSPAHGFAHAIAEVEEGRDARVTLALTPLGRVQGRVVDEDGRGVAGAAVVAVDPGTHELVPELEGASVRLLTVAGRMQATQTDADGRFELKTLMSTNPRLAVRAEGYAPAGAPVEVQTNGEAAPVEIRLTRQGT